MAAISADVDSQRLRLTGVQPRATTPFYMCAVIGRRSKDTKGKFSYEAVVCAADRLGGAAGFINIGTEGTVGISLAAYQESPPTPMTEMGLQVTPL